MYTSADPFLLVKWVPASSRLSDCIIVSADSITVCKILYKILKMMFALNKVSLSGSIYSIFYTQVRCNFLWTVECTRIWSSWATSARHCAKISSWQENHHLMRFYSWFCHCIGLYFREEMQNGKSPSATTNEKWYLHMLRDYVLPQLRNEYSCTFHLKWKNCLLTPLKLCIKQRFCKFKLNQRILIQQEDYCLDDE